VGKFSNDSDGRMTLRLEMACEEVALEPGQEVELLAEDREEFFPVTIVYHNDALQIYPQHGSPKWLIRFKGKDIVPRYPTVISEHD